MRFLFFALFISATIHARVDYELLRFEASDYRDWSFEEMAQKVGEASALLPRYACDGVSEFDPYLPPLRSNPRADSLKVRSHTTKELYTYREGRFYNIQGREVSRFDDSFLDLASRALKRLEKLVATQKILRFLETSYFPLILTFGGNSFNPQIESGKFWSGIKMAQAITNFLYLRMSDGLAFSDIGVGGEIRWHPKMKLETIEADGIKRPLDTTIALAHELFHAFDSIRGLLDMRFVTGAKYERESVLEYRAVWFENQVRRELGVLYRKHYSDPYLPPHEAQDLLDDQGDPIFIPSPCL